MPPSTKPIFAACLAILLSGTTTHAQAPGVDAAEFVRIPPKSPAEELEHLHIKPGFRLELVAAEPLVEDPVAICFDEAGRLFVAELHDHQHTPDPRTSKVKMLTDTDGDGTFDKATTLADKMSWITAIIPWDGGVFIGASPDLIFLKDTTGDGVADVRETVFSGFDRDEQGNISKSYHHERSLNNFNWGPGNRFYCAGGMNGGFVRNVSHPKLPPMALRKMDFSFDPRGRSARPETGSSQHGMAVDDWGNRYQTVNSNPALFPAYDLRYRLRNPGAAFPPPLASIARPNPKGPVFRRSRPEPWREARTRLRAAGLERGPIEEGGTVSGYFTGTADSAIYRGDLFPAEYRGALFVGEVSENVVHHREIHFPRDRVEPDALRPKDEPDFEFIASSDNWFRPVQIINGPGGALYIADMYRELVEAWHTIPEYILEHLDRDAGTDLGRIWRIVPDDSHAAPAPPALELADTPALVAALSSPRGWNRDTASRLLYQRQDPAAIPLLEESLQGDPAPDPRTILHTLYALDGLDALSGEQAIPFLKSPEPWLRVHALRMLEQLRESGANIPLSVPASLVDDRDPRVLYQLAFSLGAWPGKKTSGLFHEIALAFPQDEWIAAAVAASVGVEGLPDLLERLLADGDPASSVVLAVCHESGRSKIPLPRKFPVLQDDPATWVAPLAAYADGLKKSRAKLASSLGPESAALLRTRCRETLADESLPSGIREQCMRMLSLTGMPETELIATLLPLLSPGVSGSLQSAAASAYRAGARSEKAGEALVAFIPKSDAHLRSSLVHLLTIRPTWCRILLVAVRGGTLQAMEVPAADAAFLRKHSDAEIAKTATVLFPPPPDRASVVARFQRSLTLPGDIARGEKIFRERCIVCHRFGEEGGQVGPAMGEYQKHGKGQILLNLLNPNKNVQPDYIGYVLTTDTGDIVIGRVIEDTSAGVKIRDAAGNDHDFTRTQVASLVSTGHSLMPEGLEAGLEEKDLADLLEFTTNATIPPTPTP